MIDLIKKRVEESLKDQNKQIVKDSLLIYEILNEISKFSEYIKGKSLDYLTSGNFDYVKEYANYIKHLPKTTIDNRESIFTEIDFYDIDNNFKSFEINRYSPINPNNIDTIEDWMLYDYYDDALLKYRNKISVLSDDRNHW